VGGREEVGQGAASLPGAKAKADTCFGPNRPFYLRGNGREFCDSASSRGRRGPVRQGAVLV
jgi:hypothetical protein